jgi:hypothetical protein
MTTKTEAVPASPAGERAESFKEEVRSLKIKDPNASRDGLFLTIGGAVMIIGVVLAIVSYFMSHGTNSVLTQNDSLTVGMIGIALTIFGGALFLRYSISGFLRFWLARFLFEQQNRD